MVRPEIIRYLVGPVPVLTASALFLLASLLLSWTAQNNESYGQWYSALLVVNIVGIVTLSIFFIANLLRLVRQFRNRVMGSRLMVRFVALFTVLTLLPIAVIYYFAGQFVSKGVDSWFDVKIEQALDDASLLGKSFLEASKQTLIDKAQDDVARLAFSQSQREMIRLLQVIRDQRGYQEITLFDANGLIIASSHANASVLVPDSPGEEDLREAVNGAIKSKLEPLGDSLQYRVLAPVFSTGLATLPRVLQIRELLPLRYARLSESLQAASTEYNRINYLRRPLKISFLISLSLITLMTTLISLWLALYAARRLVAPIRDLAEGTQAVAAGDYETRLPVKSGDEFGMLVTSFNTMTDKVRKAQTLARQNQLQAEDQHTYLQTVLAHLSSGVMSFDVMGKLQTANAAASAILSVELQRYINISPAAIAAEQPRLSPLLDVIQNGLDAQISETEMEIQFEGEAGGKTLSLGLTRIQQEAGEELSGLSAGYVAVFDDVTNLIQAQREAAWGEVAQRLAHEIKNPLTPIQLSSERIRRKYLHTLPEDQRDALDRSTRTISEQVDAMKRMVDAFSSYARSARLSLTEVNLNRLIEDVVYLYRQPDKAEELVYELAEDLPLLQADPDGLRQVLNNLIANAYDATEEVAERHVTISTKLVLNKQQQSIEMRVRDNGSGYPDNIIERIFEPYVTTKTKGTGLGMAIVKRIVDRHKGQISARNEDGSAVVTVCLPVSTRSNQGMVQEGKDQKGRAQKGIAEEGKV